jgi:hypothetical protein
MTLPKTTAIPPQLHRDLIEADNAVKAIQQMMQMFQQQCQARLSESQGKARAAWERIAADTGIDLSTVAWEPHPTDPAVVPVGMRLSKGTFNG